MPDVEFDSITGTGTLAANTHFLGCQLGTASADIGTQYKLSDMLSVGMLAVPSIGTTSISGTDTIVLDHGGTLVTGTVANIVAAAGGASTAVKIIQGTTTLSSTCNTLTLSAGLIASGSGANITISAPGDVAIAQGYSGDGTLGANGTCMELNVPPGVTVKFPAGLSGVYNAKLNTGPAAPWTGKFYINGSSVGTLSYATGSTTETLSGFGTTTLSIVGPGIFNLLGPATPDTAFAGLHFSALGSRS